MTDQDRQRERAQWLTDHVLPLEPWLRQWLARRGWPGIDPDDFVQDCYARLLQADGVGHVANTRGYLARTARSIVIDHHRRSLVVRFESVADPDMFGFAADEVPQDEALDARVRLARVSGAVDRLPPKRREVLLLRRMNEVPLRATAERMGLSESMVEKHLRLALIALRAAADGERAGAIAVAA